MFEVVVVLVGLGNGWPLIRIPVGPKIIVWPESTVVKDVAPVTNIVIPSYM